MKTIILPFDGFYGTLHGDAIDSDHERCLDDEPGIHLNYKKARNLYAKAYVDAFNVAMRQRISGQWCDLTFKFHKLKSPREYNFANDIIIVEASNTMINIMMARIDWQEMTNLVQDMCASRSGFISRYSHNIGDWDNWTQWDENQLGIALQSWCELELGEGWQYKDIDLLVHEVIDDAYS